MKKHVFALLLVVALLVGMIPTAVMAEEVAEDIPAKMNLILTGKPTLVVKYAKDDVANYQDLKVTFGIGDGVTVQGEDSGDYYVFTTEVMAARLYNTISVTLKSGEAVVDACEFDLAGNYAAAAKEADPACSDLVDSLIAYTNYAAAYTGTPDTDTIQAVEKITELAGGYKKVVIQNENGVGVIPVLNEACDLYFTFPDNTHTVYVNGEAVELQANDGLLDTEKSHYYAITEILPQNWADPYVVEVYDGETLTTQFSYSVMSYVKSKLSADNADLANLLKAMYIYHRDAEMYVRMTERETESFANLNAWTLPTAEGTTQPTINANGQLEFNVTTGNNNNYVSKAISDGTNINNGTMVIDVDFKVPTTGAADIGVMSGSNYVIRVFANHNQLRHATKQNGTTPAVDATQDNDGFALTLSDMHHARLVLDMTHKKYDLYIDGIRWIAGQTILTNYGNANGLTLRLGVYGTGTGVICFDNVKVSKLNPGAVDLTTDGLKKTLYEHTFDSDLPTSGSPRWTLTEGSAKVEDGKLVVTPSSSNEYREAITIDEGYQGKFAFEVDVETNYMISNKGIWIMLGDGSTANLVSLQLFSNSVKYGTTLTTVSNTYFGPNSVYRVKLIVDMDTHQYDIYINDVLLKNQVSFAETATSITKIRIGAAGKADNWTIKFDNLKISQILTAE